jgi:hypothetical protein
MINPLYQSIRLFDNARFALSTPSAFYFEPLLANFDKLMIMYQATE